MLLYQTNVSEVTNNGFACPPASASESTREAYRWVFSPITEGCFHPQAVRNPPRLLNERDPEKRCSCWALSMHETLDQSVAAFKAVEKSFKNARKVLGNAVACGMLAQADGLSTPADEFGHFDLHPYKTSSLIMKFSVVTVMP